MQDKLMEAMWSTGHLSGSNVQYVENLYEDFLSDPASIPEQWRELFQSLPAINGADEKKKYRMQRLKKIL